MVTIVTRHLMTWVGQIAILNWMLFFCLYLYHAIESTQAFNCQLFLLANFNTKAIADAAVAVAVVVVVVDAFVALGEGYSSEQVIVSF